MGKKVLVVDDSGTVRSQVVTAIGSLGYESIEAGDGRQGLSAIKSNKDISMVICDVNMPNMNGLDMLEAVKADSAHKNLPIMMLTTEGNPMLIKRAKAAGAMGWMVKPFKEPQLAAAVKKVMG